MDQPRNRKVLIGTLAALGVFVGLGLAAVRLGRPDSEATAGGGPGELTVQTGLADDPRLDPGHLLKCFVNGQAVGELRLQDCARRNGVAPGALDVGLDANGALGASNGLTSALTPLPPSAEDPNLTGAQGGTPAPGPEVASTDEAPARLAAPTESLGGCWRYGDGGWSRLPDEAPLKACIRSLFDGQCEPPGAVAYGRWHGRTLRLVAGGVDISADNRVFHPAARQSADCTFEAQIP